MLRSFEHRNTTTRSQMGRLNSVQPKWQPAQTADVTHMYSKLLLGSLVWKGHWEGLTYSKESGSYDTLIVKRIKGLGIWSAQSGGDSWLLPDRIYTAAALSISYAHLLSTSSSSFIVSDLLSYVTCCIQAPNICPYLFLIPLYVSLPVFEQHSKEGLTLSL